MNYDKGKQEKERKKKRESRVHGCGRGWRGERVSDIWEKRGKKGLYSTGEGDGEGRADEHEGVRLL